MKKICTGFPIVVQTYTVPEKVPCIVMKIIEIDFLFKEKTRSKSRTIDESSCPAAKRISSEFFDYNN